MIRQGEHHRDVVSDDIELFKMPLEDLLSCQRTTGHSLRHRTESGPRKERRPSHRRRCMAERQASQWQFKSGVLTVERSGDDRARTGNLRLAKPRGPQADLSRITAKPHKTRDFTADMDGTRQVSNVYKNFPPPIFWGKMSCRDQIPSPSSARRRRVT